MNKNILVKLLCLALACMLVLPMIVACGGGPSYVVTFDANGGVIEEDGEEYEEWDKYVAEGERIGSLPSPKRPGYVFDGWYEEEDEDFEDKIRKTTKVEYDMVLVAKWKQVGWGEPGSVGTVEFDFDGGHIIEVDEDGEEVEVDELILDVEYNDRVGTLPKPEREGYSFDGWFFENKNGSREQLRATTVMKEMQAIVAVAKWTEIPKCNDGTYNHIWGGWDDTYQMATCTQDGVSARYCTICQSKETSIQTPATGHSYSAWIDNFDPSVMGSERTCSACSYVDKDQFRNVMSSAMGGENVVIDGQAFGTGNAGCVTNGTWGDEWKTTFQANGSSLTLTFDFQKATYADFLVIQTTGAGVGFSIYYLEEGATDYTLLTKSGSPGLVKFELGKKIEGIKIQENSSSQGMLGWQEVALLVRSANYVAE
ncbi:MAG: InlB B-repeat-containing protein [Clostridia bacterium]|nr:InlB B-repeat-containing protein [Clostridia bacterium]